MSEELDHRGDWIPSDGASLQYVWVNEKRLSCLSLLREFPANYDLANVCDRLWHVFGNGRMLVSCFHAECAAIRLKTAVGTVNTANILNDSWRRYLNRTISPNDYATMILKPPVMNR